MAIPAPTRFNAGVLKELGLAATLALTGAQVVPESNVTPAASSAVTQWRGVNWADPRDNYAHDAVVPSGLSTSDSYRQVVKKATRIVREFKADLGANTVRLPINPWSVGTRWWKAYRGAIDAATKQGDKVILSYWEADDAEDGKIDNTRRWTTMWNTVVKAYAKNKRVYFEPMNEPWGYSLKQWVAICATWLAHHKNVPRARVVVSGTGNNVDVTGVGASPKLKGTLLSFHYYSFYGSYTTEQEWLDEMTPRIGAYASRTIVDEAGAPMTTGIDYGSPDGSVENAYLNAVADLAASEHLGLVYWPGLRDGDSYSLETRTAGGKLAVTNASGLALLRRGWGYAVSAP